MDQQRKVCMKRLMKDLEEFSKAPGENVSAVPLEENLLEWHCNIRQEELIFHLILFFPPEYPYKPPSAEFVPQGFSYAGGATKAGKKGTQICLNIFSDFEYVHTEWANLLGVGWSPGYTVQTILYNVVSFLRENESTYGGHYHRNLNLSKSFVCSDCGHSYEKPFPSLADLPKSEDKSNLTETSPASKNEQVQQEQSPNQELEIIDYISKAKFDPKSDKLEYTLFGFGLIVNGAPGRAKLTTPCEYLTAHSFYNMKESVKIVHSVSKVPLSFFLPLFIHPSHGSHVQSEFEKTMNALAKGVVIPDSNNVSIEDVILKTLPNLMCATVVDFFKGTQYTSENSLNGYFALHRLFLWCLETYPALQTKVETIITDFINNETMRNKSVCPDVGQWLMLLAGSQLYKWQDVADAYLKESWRRNVAWYIKSDPLLAVMNTNQDYRLKETFKLTEVSRNLLAFHVVFLEIAMPEGETRQDIIKRYDANLGFPTKEMVDKMKLACHKIKEETHTYAEWYSILKIPVPSDKEVFESLVDALCFALITSGYHWT